MIPDGHPNIPLGVVGRINTGEPGVGNGAPKQLNHFRIQTFTSAQGGEHAIDERAMAFLGEYPRIRVRPAAATAARCWTWSRSIRDGSSAYCSSRKRGVGIWVVNGFRKHEPPPAMRELVVWGAENVKPRRLALKCKGEFCPMVLEPPTHENHKGETIEDPCRLRRAFYFEVSGIPGLHEFVTTSPPIGDQLQGFLEAMEEREGSRLHELDMELVMVRRATAYRETTRRVVLQLAPPMGAGRADAPDPEQQEQQEQQETPATAPGPAKPETTDDDLRRALGKMSLDYDNVDGWHRARGYSPLVKLSPEVRDKLLGYLATTEGAGAVGDYVRHKNDEASK